MTQLVWSNAYSPTLFCKKGFDGLLERFLRMKGRCSICFLTCLQEIGGGILRYVVVLQATLDVKLVVIG
jgi:hypothetical protein